MAEQVYKICVITSLPRTNTKDRDGLFAGTYNTDAAYRRRRFDFSSWRGFWFSLKHILRPNLFVGCGALGVKATTKERDRGWRVFVQAFRLGEVFPVQMLKADPESDLCEEVGWGRKPHKFGGVTYRLFGLHHTMEAIQLSYKIADLFVWLPPERRYPFPVGKAFDHLYRIMKAEREDRK